VGKTRLVHAFKDWVLLDTPETEIWQGQAFETGGRLAFQSVIEALRLRLDQVNAPEDILEDVWLAELSQLMPELRARYPDLPIPLTGNAKFVRTRLFESIATLGNALAARHPSILMLDDMQWADADTQDLIHYLARRWAEMKAPILLILAVRQEAYAVDSSLREWLTRLERDTSLTRILLDNLNGTAVEGLVKTLAEEKTDETVTSAFAAWLWAETRGLPFFIEALLQMLIEQGILVPGKGQQPTYNLASALEHVRSVSSVPVPPGVREVIRARLEGHSKEAGSLLLAAAVLGHACTFERMCQIADIQETEALESLEALLDGRLLTEHSSDRRPYSPAHDYIREVVYTESNEARRRVYHRRALLALEAAGEPAAECAFHALAALLDEPAFRYSVAAGGEAFASYAMQEALSHFNTAREAAQRMRDRGENVDLELLEGLYKGRGKVLRLNQEDEAAAANYEEMYAEGEMRHSRAMQLSSLIAHSNLHSHPTGVYNPSKARESGQAALALAQELGDRAAQVRALWALQNAELYSAGDTRKIIAYGQEALALARELGSKELMAHALKNLCWPFGAQKHIEQAREELAEAQSIWQELGNLQKLAEASRLMLIFHYQAGDHRSIFNDALKLSDLGASIGSHLDEVEGLAWLVITYIRQGRFSKALNYLDQYGAYAESLGYPHEKHGHQWGRIKYYLAVGALDEAGRWANDLFAERKTIPPNFIAAYFTEVVRVKIALGKLDESRNILDELLANLPLDAPFSYVIIDIALAYAEINLALGQPENIFEGLDDRVRPYRESGFGYLLAVELWLRGRAALMMGQYDAARESLLKAREAAEAQEERSILWKILRTMSEAEKECGNADLAEKLLGQARLVVEDIAEHAGEMREVFLGQPEVVQLLGES
jgi:tetratricopeptide (TPR) repeat protein